MEIILGSLVIIMLLLILGFSWGLIVIWIVYLVIGMLSLTELLFVYCLLRLIAAKSMDGHFSRIDKVDSKGFDRAYYATKDGEFPNIFPCEVVMREKIYIKDKPIRIRIDRSGKKRRAYDRNATITILLGLVLCPLCVIFPVLLTMMLV